MSILRIDSSATTEGSVSRTLTDRVLANLPAAPIVTRDLAATPLPQIDESWVNARLVPAQDRTAEEREILALSDELIAELHQADTIVIGVPMYNFSLPASLKAWIDLIARPGETFRYSEAGPEGLLKGKQAIIVATSGGVPVGSPADFATGYLTHVLGFVGITDVAIVAADRMAVTPDDALARAHAQIDGLRAAA